jgi:hypothetical protein
MNQEMKIKDLIHPKQVMYLEELLLVIALKDILRKKVIFMEIKILNKNWT